MRTSSPPLSASVTTRSKASKCLWASLVDTLASWATLSMSSVLFTTAPSSRRLRLFGGPVGVAYPLFVREAEPLAIPVFRVGFAEQTLWGCAVVYTPHLVRWPWDGA